MRLRHSGLIVLALLSTAAAAQTGPWKPVRNVEIVVGVGPGGGIDRTARFIQKLVQDQRLVEVPVTVSNKPGGGSTIAHAYISQKAGDAHFLEISATSILTNHITGKTAFSHKDFTPVAMLSDEYIGFLVRADSPLKTGKDLVEALAKNPASISIALTSSGHRVSVGLPLHKAGVTIKSVRMPAFKGGGETAMAVLGGHADVQITSVSTSVPHVTSGQMRVIAISSSKRMGGVMAQVPTWQELGYQSYGSWKGVMAPKGITPAQIAYWEDVMRKTAQSSEIQQYAEQNLWLVEFKGAAETRKWLDDEAFHRSVVARIPLGRVGDPSDVAAAVIYLSSPAASLVTGTTLMVDGGWTIQ